MKKIAIQYQDKFLDFSLQMDQYKNNPQSTDFFRLVGKK